MRINKHLVTDCPSQEVLTQLPNMEHPLKVIRTEKIRSGILLFISTILVTNVLVLWICLKVSQMLSKDHFIYLFIVVCLIHADQYKKSQLYWCFLYYLLKRKKYFPHASNIIYFYEGGLASGYCRFPFWKEEKRKVITTNVGAPIYLTHHGV